MSRKLQEKQERRLAEERRKAEIKRAARRRNLITVTVALIVGAGVVFSIAQTRSEQENPNKGAPVGVSSAAAGCSDIEDPKLGDAKHVEVGTEVLDYSSLPPTSGSHYPVPADPGFYSSPLPAQQVVHNLEHGMIVIWYKPDAPQQTVDDIEKVVQQQPEATVALPYEDVPSPHTFSLTAWGHLQSCSQVSQEVIDNFRRKYQGQGPERVVPPFEG